MKLVFAQPCFVVPLDLVFTSTSMKHNTQFDLTLSRFVVPSHKLS
jgi:hypothetical protein